MLGGGGGGWGRQHLPAPVAVRRSDTAQPGWDGAKAGRVGTATRMTGSTRPLLACSMEKGPTTQAYGGLGDVRG